MSNRISINRFDFEILKKYQNPAIQLFRGIELKILLDKISKFKFENPGLDLGCGDGFICSVVFKSKLHYGLDNNELGDVQIAKKNKVYEKIIIESAEKISLPDRSVNFVFSNSVIEHIPNNEKVLSEVSRILKPGGYFVFTAPSVFFTKYLIKKYGKTYTNFRNHQFNHFHLLSFEQWKKRLNGVGLITKDYCYYMDEKQLYQWEKLLWKQKIKNLFPYLINQTSSVENIKNIITTAKNSKKEGANILIVSKKV